MDLYDSGEQKHRKKVVFLTFVQGKNGHKNLRRVCQ